MRSNELPLTEDIDFHYLLSLMPPLSNEPEFEWLPELFSIIDIDSLLKLCKYCGGETIKIPTLDQLQKSIDALQWFYDVDIKHSRSYDAMPSELTELVNKVRSIYYARTDEEETSGDA